MPTYTLRPIRMGFAALSGMAFLLFSIAARGQDSITDLQPPAGEKLILRAHAKGDQIYSCGKNGGQYAWTLKAPQAELFDVGGKSIGRHFAGPNWQLDDGSQVTGKVVAHADSPDADSIPWLLLSATGHSGDGRLSGATSIQRLHTKGGKAPANGCDAAHEGNESRVGYTADYYFYGK